MTAAAISRANSCRCKLQCAGLGCWQCSENALCVSSAMEHRRDINLLPILLLTSLAILLRKIVHKHDHQAGTGMLSVGRKAIRQTACNAFLKWGDARYLPRHIARLHTLRA